MDLKYIELLISKCTNLKEKKILFLSFNKEIRPFIDKLVEYCHKIGVEEIYLEEEDRYLIHDELVRMSSDEIRKSPYFDKSIWDEYAKKGASFLMFETEIPHLMDDVEPSNLALAAKLKRSTKPIYRKLQKSCKLSWAIVAYPGVKWAKEVFPDTADSYEKLKSCIYKMCMIDKENPMLEWAKLLAKNYVIMERLNKLGLEKLHYQNSLGTDLTLYLPEGYLYSSAKDNDVIVNMPSYEVFTSPVYDKTEGIVYSSKPLVYNGSLIEEFYLKFVGGRVVDFDAKCGKEILGDIINTDDNSCFLGEAALVESGSPIDAMGINFGTTLIDENASCHLALGDGFGECIVNGLDMSDEELLKKGINSSKQHVDFMIGTSDLKITGYTKDGQVVKIFENGKFSEWLVG